MNTEKARVRRAARMQAARQNRRKGRAGLKTKRAKLRSIRRHLMKAGFDLYPKIWETTCSLCNGYRARLIWTIEAKPSPK